MLVINLNLRTAAYAAFSFFLGYAAWAGDVSFLPLSWGFVALWSLSKTRLSAFVVALMYYLAAARGMVAGATLFFSDTTNVPVHFIGVGLWLVSGAILAAVWAAGWGREYIWARTIAVLVVLSIPPFGIIGWANPLTAAGAVFPGWGWGGLILAIAVMSCLAYLMRWPARQRLGAAAGLMFYLVAMGFVANFKAHITPASNVVAVDTSVGQSADPYSQYIATRLLAKTMLHKVSSGPDGLVYVLPESVGGDWSINRAYWSKVASAAKTKGAVVLVGGWMPLSGGHYQNALFAMGAGGDYKLVQRVPIPISMWKPFSSDGAVAALGGSGITKVGGYTAANLVCYEQILVWPVLLSMWHSPSIILSVSNTWWAKGTSIPTIQEEAVSAWSRLFSVPYVFAINK